jgi:hypothetical protein
MGNAFLEWKVNGAFIRQMGFSKSKALLSSLEKKEMG